MLTVRDIAAVIVGTGRLLRWDASGLHAYDASLPGFWRSFTAVLVALPMDMLIHAGSLAGESVHSPGRYALVQVLALVMGWTAFPLLMIPISDLLGRWPRYFRCMVALNWFRPVQSLLLLPPNLLGLIPGVSGDVQAFLTLALLAAVLLYEWFIIARGLEVEGFTAASIVTIDLLVSFIISGLADSISG
ncbi:MAG: hypothetical protein K2Q10_00420 [Rhodospirillales bacterium]|nr:hypothetical protein [Rhodospirillales bacterium]